MYEINFLKSYARDKIERSSYNILIVALKDWLTILVSILKFRENTS